MAGDRRRDHWEDNGKVRKEWGGVIGQRGHSFRMIWDEVCPVNTLHCDRQIQWCRNLELKGHSTEDGTLMGLLFI